MDGRDTDPKSGLGFMRELEAKLESGELPGKVASMIGRYYAMDRDKRWERVKEAYDLLTKGTGKAAPRMSDALEASYAEGVTDEFVKATVGIDAEGQPLGLIRPGDAVLFLNFRNDRAKELTTVLTQREESGMTPIPIFFATMTPYDASFTGLTVLFPKENVVNTIGEWVAKQGLTQLRIAETEKYAHVTFFLNGGREAPFEGEDRILVPSPKVATYDLKPEMSAPEVAEKLAAALREERFDFVCLNFANGDMVGHEGRRRRGEDRGGGGFGIRLRSRPDRRPRERRLRDECGREPQHGAFLVARADHGGEQEGRGGSIRRLGGRRAHRARDDGGGGAR